MLKLRYPILAVVGLLFCGSLAWSQPLDVRAVAHSVDEHYNHLKTFKAAFTEIYQGDGISRTESGTLWLKKPSRMRWEYHVPREKLFLIDSQTAYFYVTGDRQAKKTPAKNLDDLRSPLRYLLGKTKLEKELDGLSLAPDLNPLQPGDVVMRGVPKILKDRVSEVVLEVSPSHQIHRIVIHGLDSTITDFRFSQIEENVPVQDSLFRFTPPPGVDTIEENQVTQ
ncbi:MAG TPA: outer membrane lipoprotein carrier protein LolA [Candidatus Angelobacter sp.]|nr:outer membrane lipoprotein carrier protein LolA [Candidatus Angelobacter sp.]